MRKHPTLMSEYKNDSTVILSTSYGFFFLFFFVIFQATLTAGLVSWPRATDVTLHFGAIPALTACATEGNQFAQARLIAIFDGWTKALWGPQEILLFSFRRRQQQKSKNSMGLGG